MKTRTPPGAPALLLLLLTLSPLAAPAGGAAAAQVESTGGVVEAGLELRGLDGVKRVLLIGAHPDDEDTSLLAALARGRGAEVAYLSLSRGEGGQNLIGPELDEGLGLVRTGELLAARSLDGGRQFFSRAYDFGYSKSAGETFRYWPEEEVLADVVWVVRSFRPQVIVSIFSGTPDDGHGHHQVAGIVAHEAFEAAGDPGRFPEQLTGPDSVEPWSPAKLYRSARFRPDRTTTELETGTFDTLLGRSWFQLAMESRSRHRSQSMGAPEPMGPRSARLELVRGGSGRPADDPGIFAGVDTGLVSIVRAAPGVADRTRERLAEAAERYRGLVADARSRLDAYRPAAAVSPLARAYGALRGALGRAGPESGDVGRALSRTLERRLGRTRDAILAAAGIVVDVSTDEDLLVPGEPVELEVAVWNGGPFRIERAEPALTLPRGWEAEELEAEPPGQGDSFRALLYGSDPESFVHGPSPVEAGHVARWRFRVRPPRDARLSRPYYMERPRDGEMYRWPDDRSLWTLPRKPAAVEGRVEISLSTAAAGAAADRPGSQGVRVDLEVHRPAESVSVDPARGQLRQPLLVAPPVSIGTAPEVMVWPQDSREARPVTVSLRNASREGFRGTVRLEVPGGWEVEPESVAVELPEPGRERSLTFRIRPDAGEPAGRYRLRAVARTDGESREEGVGEGFRVVDYPHIDRALLFREAATRVSRFPVRVDRSLRVGYVMGSGDGGPEALRQLGADVRVLDGEEVREGAFDPYDAIVLGVRSYETRPELRGANAGLLDWVRNGGTLIVQYDRYEFSEGGYAPYPLRIDRPHDRVTHETATVSVLDPDSPVFTAPNSIRPGDFEGWVQERGLYFPAEWDDRYTPLLEMSDPGEEPARGSLLVAPVGDGLWIYTGLAFFRQFPEGVPGAYRLFANLVSLRAEEWREHHGGGSG